MPLDELAARRTGIRAGGWVVIPPIRGDLPALAGFVIEVRDTEVIVDVPVRGQLWQRARVPISHVVEAVPTWVTPSGGEAA